MNKKLAFLACLVVLLNLLFMPLNDFIKYIDEANKQIDSKLIATYAEPWEKW